MTFLKLHGRQISTKKSESFWLVLADFDTQNLIFVAS